MTSRYCSGVFVNVTENCLILANSFHRLSPKDTVFRPNKTLCVRGDLLHLADPVVMGILNVTPDSFFDGGSYTTEAQILLRAERILSEGATFIDVGGYSTRPHAPDIPEEEERARVLPAIRCILKAFPRAYVSVDTFRARVAQSAVEAGACLVNDVSGGTLDARMFETVSQLNVPYVLMHTRGTPQTMTRLTDYRDVTLEVLDDLQKKIFALRSLGQKDILLDVGFGFAKTREQSFELLENLNYFEALRAPLLVGVSRKSMVYQTLGTTAAEALNGTTVLNTLALTKGASVLRVHDVREAVEAVKLHGMMVRTRSRAGLD
ncbi:MAG: dihydropteroate synthase [Ferruginibacter sp.]|nr:dihydropteroate synthase [Cytophagales bacterium]